MFVLPHRTTRIILGFICWLNIVWSLENIVHCSVTFFPMEELEDRLQLTKILSMIESILNPLYASIQKLYVVYSIHRYAIITSKAIMFTNPIWMILFLVFALSFVYATESLHILDEYFYTDTKNLIKGFKAFSGVLFIGHSVLKLLLDAFCTSVHVFVLRSITKTLTESKNFLRSLNPTKNIKQRLMAISGILKFNRVLLFLQVVVPLFQVIKSTSGMWVVYCSNCDYRTLAIAYFVLDSIYNIVGAVQSTVFAFIHIRFMTIFSCKREQNAVE